MPNKKSKANAVGGQVKNGGNRGGGDPILDLDALITNGGGTTSFGGTGISVTPLAEPVVNGMTSSTTAAHTCTHEHTPTLTTTESESTAARAKALFMSSLGPGSEAFSSHKIADPRDTVGTTMRAPWAPVAGVPGVSALPAAGGGHLQNKSTSKDKGTDKASVASSSSSSYNPQHHNIHCDGFDDLRRDFLGDWIDGKPLDKYIEAAKLKPTLTKPPSQLDRDSTTTQTVTITKSGTSTVCTKPQQSQLQIQTRTQNEAQGGSSSRGVKQQRETEEVKSTTPKQWKRSFVNHDNFLSECQVMAFVSGDVQSKNQIQAALTKVLMRKLPNPDLQILWAIMYGGEDAPWPGSLSPVIPGVTTTATAAAVPTTDTHLSQADEG
ncbi:hypothetical protein H2204_011929 [Knufia peltigerae]|uniref:Uncharacterized protein n=1 Tax=Knufia peltigerae TaxID=1002370 RepID=A0AA38XTD3_9EURO|nr:hypothetical protein H2204_011929 [Knufia peltigerae]